MMTQYRQHFPWCDRYHYFNYGGQGMLPQVALDAMQQAQIQVQAIAPFSNAANNWINATTDALRSTIATELNILPETLTLTENSTTGCNIALWGIDWRAGDRVLITDCEHYGVMAILHEIKHRFGVEIDICPPALILTALQPRTRMVVLSHVLWNTGEVLPLADIAATCRSRGVLTLVDAAQSVGMLPLDLGAIGADFYAFTGHKWWCGPAGVGGLYVHPESRDQLRPSFIGWRSVRTDAQGHPTEFQPDGRRYEVATAAVPLYPGLTAAIGLHRSFGSSQQRYELIADRSRQLWSQLDQMTGIHCVSSQPPESGLVSFQVENHSHQKLVAALEAAGIYVRLLLDPNCIRACLHYFSTEVEILQLVSTIAKLTRH
jgi:L-cysteine/cystine lyase